MQSSGLIFERLQNDARAFIYSGLLDGKKFNSSFSDMLFRVCVQFVFAAYFGLNQNPKIIPGNSWEYTGTDCF